MGKLIRQTAPYIRNGATVNKMMLNVIISLLPVVAFSIYRYGMDAIILIATSVATMVLVEFLYTKIKKQKTTIGDFSAVITGLIFAMTLPDQTPIYAVIVCSALGMYLSKCMFGGLGNNIFNVAAVSRVMLALAFGGQIAYTVDGVAGATALQTLSASGMDAAIQAFPITNLFTGIGIGGTLGEVSALCILIGAAWLIFTKAADWKIMASYIGFAAVFALVLAVGSGSSDILSYVLFHLFSGGILFGAVYMATDPVTAPVLETSKIYYGFGLAALTMLIRAFGSLPEGTVFAILLMNMLAPALEYYEYCNNKFTVRSLSIFALVIVLTCGLMFVGV